ncbi:Aldo/keto reductase [Lophiostoma macrostomum CBS 122681]|uniref:Aldo/keto reductase n=1 Tax=Lophiostoma macrostomum CBS 122681 TaxID=1314788 RepID=A0A6A6T8X8_9PLEO|nr:Aldo/keto reductase [Lophiostoma macrostomum CBS 122681]
MPPNAPPEEQAIECLRVAAEAGSLVWNAGEFYGTLEYNSLVLLNHFFAKYPEYIDKVILNVKGAMLPTFQPSGQPEIVRKSVENCVRQLGREIEMFETARIDLDVPLKTQVTTLSELVAAGKIGGVALTEVSAKTIREAAKLTNIAAVEIELSIWCTDALHNNVLSTCAELEIPIIAFLLSYEDIPQDDYRRMLPRYQPGNLEHNLDLVKAVEGMAETLGRTTAQVALGWLLALSEREDMPVVTPIPGSTSTEHIKENLAAVPLTDGQMEILDSIIAEHPIVGERYHPQGTKYANI